MPLKCYHLILNVSNSKVRIHVKHGVIKVSTFIVRIILCMFSDLGQIQSGGAVFANSFCLIKNTIFIQNCRLCRLLCQLQHNFETIVSVISPALNKLFLKPNMYLIYDDARLSVGQTQPWVKSRKRDKAWKKKKKLKLIFILLFSEILFLSRKGKVNIGIMIIADRRNRENWFSRTRCFVEKYTDS